MTDTATVTVVAHTVGRVPEERLIAAGDVARELGVHPRTVSRWVQQGVLIPAEITAGGRSRFRMTEVRAQLRARRQTGNNS